MKAKYLIIAALAGFFIWVTAMSMASVTKEPVKRMTTEELKNRLNDSEIVIFDVRAAKSWDASDKKIKGAYREVPKEAGEWADKYVKNKTYVLYCS
jgi:rhodanese-related sulfurtransferase